MRKFGGKECALVARDGSGWGSMGDAFVLQRTWWAGDGDDSRSPTKREELPALQPISRLAPGCANCSESFLLKLPKHNVHELCTFHIEKRSFLLPVF